MSSYTAQRFLNYGYNANNVKQVLSDPKFFKKNISIVLQELKTLKRIRNASRHATVANAARRKHEAERAAANNRTTELREQFRLAKMKAEEARSSRLNNLQAKLNAKNAEHKRAMNAKNAELNALRTQLARLKNSLRQNEARRRIAEREKEAVQEEKIKLRERFNN